MQEGLQPSCKPSPAVHSRGTLDSQWANSFDELSLSHESNGTTLLSGRAVDQAALDGSLRKIRDLGLPLLSVREVEPGQANEPDGIADSDHKNKETHI